MKQAPTIGVVRASRPRWVACFGRWAFSRVRSRKPALKEGCKWNPQVQRNATSSRESRPVQPHSLAVDEIDLSAPVTAAQRAALSPEPLGAEAAGGRTQAPTGACEHDRTRILNSIKEVNWGKVSKTLSESALVGVESRTRDICVSKPALKAAVRKRWTIPIAQELLRQGEENAALKLGRCGEFLRFRHFEMSRQTRLRSGNFCQQPKLCVPCANARAIKTGITYRDKAIELIQRHDLVPMMVTVTQKAGDDFGECFGRLRDSLQKLRQRIKDHHKGRTASEWAKFEAIVWHVEVKRGSGSGQWHVHAHSLALRPIDQLLDFDKLHQEWTALSGNRGRPNVKLLRSAYQLLETRDIDACRDRLRIDLLEVFKYSLKFGDDCTPPDVVEVWRRSRRKRFLMPWGKFNGLKVPDDWDDRTDELGVWHDYVYRWLWAGAQYKQTEVRRGFTKRESNDES